MHVHLATPSAKAMWRTYLLLIAPLCFSHFQDISVKFLASPPVYSSVLGKLQPEASIAAADFPLLFSNKFATFTDNALFGLFTLCSK